MIAPQQSPEKASCVALVSPVSVRALSNAHQILQKVLVSLVPGPGTRLHMLLQLALQSSINATSRQIRHVLYGFGKS